MKGKLFKAAAAAVLTLTCIPETMPFFKTAATVWADTDVISISRPILINSGNLSTYNNKTLTGQVRRSSSYDGAVVVDGVEANLTIDGLTGDYSSTEYYRFSGIVLKNNATLHLTVKGDNTLKADYGGAGIAVFEGCTLEITADSTGTLTAVGGRNQGGGAGIGAIGNNYYYDAGVGVSYDVQKFGTIIINGGTINATGGTHTGVTGAAGIGGSGWDNSKTGKIEINGGNITAKENLILPCMILLLKIRLIMLQYFCRLVKQ